MAESRQVAGLVGPVLVAVTLSEILNPGVWDNVSAPETYQAGLLAFVAGLAIIRAHNRWKLGWPVVVTLVGWFGLVGGLGRMFATRLALQGAADPVVTMPLKIGLLLVGFYLCFKAYGRNDGVGPL
jgi:hypothetical protein